MPEILEIERSSFFIPWSEGSLLNEMGRSDAHFAVASENGLVIGFCVLHKAADEAELYQIAVSERCRRRGAGDLLIESAIGYAEGNGVTAIYLEVRSGNDAAVSLYRKHGFQSVGRRKNYYDKPVEDAFIMSRRVND